MYFYFIDDDENRKNRGIKFLDFDVLSDSAGCVCFQILEIKYYYYFVYLLSVLWQ